jgi:hypothetical protein
MNIEKPCKFSLVLISVLLINKKAFLFSEEGFFVVLYFDY